ncbi:MAG: hypothetical protein GX220_07225 [Treponema sp.]|nr:hypothetical protein [Treponema sp.]
MKKIISLILIFSLIFVPLFSVENNSNEIITINSVDWRKDLRRAEIVTLGSLPFTTLLATLGYQVYRYIDSGFNSKYFPNPLAKSSSDAQLNMDEQLGILIAASSLSLCVGVTDIIVNTVKRNKEIKRQRNLKLPDGMEISNEPRTLPKIKTEVEYSETAENIDLEINQLHENSQLQENLSEENFKENYE